MPAAATEAQRRDRALLLLMAAGLGRVALVDLDVERLRFAAEAVELTLAGDPVCQVAVARAANPNACPVQALRDCLRASDIRFGAVFRRSTAGAMSSIAVFAPMRSALRSGRGIGAKADRTWARATAGAGQLARSTAGDVPGDVRAAPWRLTARLWIGLAKLVQVTPPLAPGGSAPMRLRYGRERPMRTARP